MIKTPTNERWFIVKIYYSLADVNIEDDPSGDHILVNYVRPTMAHLYQQGWARWCTVMRFSEEGYHIRLTVWGDETVLSEKVQPYIQESLGRYREANPAPFSQPMALAPLAVRLNEKWGGIKDKIDLHTPGTDEMGLMYNTGEDEIYESDEAFIISQQVQADSCKRILDFLAANPSLKLRKTFVRVFLDDFLRMTDLNEVERYYFLMFLQMQWMNFFALTDEILTPYYEYYKKMEDQYHRYFDAKKGPEDSLKMLPSGLHSFYMDWINSLRGMLDKSVFVGRDAQGELTPHGGLRLQSFFHLTHNRIGVGLVQEVYLAYLLAQQYKPFLTPEQLVTAESWGKAMEHLNLDPKRSGYAEEKS